ncbi:MAG: N-acetyltransferase family protein [Christensenella sp.]|nr:N-acetyltransferase family protein [Christensenella sp.]
MLIRKAEQKDLPELLRIYNDEVINGVATLDLNPRTLEEWQIWFDHHNVENHPLYVALLDGRIAGYSSLSSYREKEAYRSTVELSIYVSPDFRKRGVATELMSFILEEAKRDERTHTVVSVITAGNEASCKLHEKFGFEFCGTIREVGVKFGKYQDIENYRLGV